MWVKILSSAVMAACVGLVGCAEKHTKKEESLTGTGQSQALPPSELQIAQNDTRQYKTLLLENGLRVLLVSDASTNKAAVSMNVDVGSGADPRGREGLAHFVEHMLFLGTEKYPEADAYQRFISENGGGHNAYTAFEDTNYFFDIEPGQLEQGLDRFSQFFVAPLFTQQYLERERNAVHSEYKAKIHNDMRRFLDVFKHQLNPEHPFSKFTVGNLDTLRTDGLAESVKTFYQKYYRSENMALVVLGKEPLDTLESWVTARFVDVPSGYVESPYIDVPMFGEEALPQVVSLKPLKNTRSLSLNFPMPGLGSQRLNKPSQLIGHLLGHEGEGSLFALLKARGWAESLSAGVFMDNPGGSLFSLNVQLTPDGLEHQEEILTLVFSTKNTIAADLAEWRYQELSTVSQIEFDNQAKAPAQRYVRSIAASLDEYAMPYWLKGGYVMAEFDQAFTQSLLDAIRPDNMMLFVADPELESAETSPWYNVPFKAEPLKQDLLKRLVAAEANEQLFLPKVNPYVPTSFALYKHDQSHQQLAARAGFEAWLVTDDSLGEPRAFSQAYLSNSQWGQSAEQAVVTALAASMIDDEANKTLYEAKAMGYAASFSGGSHGLGFSIYGFDQKLPVIAQELVKIFDTLSWQEAQFERAKAELARQLENQSLEPAYRQLHGRVRQSLLSSAWSTEALQASLQSLTFKGFVSQWQQLAEFDHLAVLMAGNIASAQQQELLVAWEGLAPQDSEQFGIPQPQVKAVANGQSRLVFDVVGDDVAVSRYYRSPVSGIKGRALAALTVQLLESGFYHEVRTEKQFGYIVYLANSLLHKTPGVVFVVQSPSRDSGEVVEAMDAFLEDQFSQESVIDTAAFDTVKASLVHNLTRPSTSVSQLGSRAWRNFQHGVTTFDEAEMIANVLKSIDLAEWEEYKLRLFGSESKQQIDFIAEKKR